LRYYKITLTDPSNGKPIVIQSPPGSSQGPLFNGTFSSLTPSGANDPGALMVEFDIPVSTLAAPAGSATVIVHGVPIQLTGQAAKFFNTNITVYGGMSKGLPLANPAQQGILMQGVVQQSFGNWLGIDQTLNFFASSGQTPLNAEANIVLHWPKGTLLADAIKQALTTAFPTYKVVDTGLGKALKLQNDETGYFGNVSQLAQWVQQISLDITNAPQGSGYTGVEIAVQQNQFVLFDGTSQTQPKNILFTDLVGQPSWIGPNSISVPMVMRGDLSINDFILMPKTAFNTQSSVNTQYASKSIFQGVFQIYKIRHTGNSRQPSGTSWITVIEANSRQAAPTTASTSSGP
jgi:hypothetical protein